MKEEIQLLIQKNLPALAAGELSEYINQSEKDKKELFDLRVKYETLRQQESSVSAENRKLKQVSDELSVQADKLEKLSKTLDEQERNLKIKELEYQLTSEKASKSSIFELVKTFVSNPRSIDVISKNTNHMTATHWTNGREERYPTGTHEFGTVEHTQEK
jgi:uncharacterized protein (DUF3084 family)